MSDLRRLVRSSFDLIVSVLLERVEEALEEDRADFDDPTDLLADFEEGDELEGVDEIILGMDEVLGVAPGPTVDDDLGFGRISWAPLTLSTAVGPQRIYSLPVQLPRVSSETFLDAIVKVTDDDAGEGEASPPASPAADPPSVPKVPPVPPSSSSWMEGLEVHELVLQPSKSVNRVLGRIRCLLQLHPRLALVMAEEWRKEDEVRLGGPSRLNSSPRGLDLFVTSLRVVSSDGVRGPDLLASHGPIPLRPKGDFPLPDPVALPAGCFLLATACLVMSLSESSRAEVEALPADARSVITAVSIGFEKS